MRLRSRLTAGLGAVGLACVALWSFWPIEPSTPAVMKLSGGESLDQTAQNPVQLAFDATAFASARLWNPPAQPQRQQPVAAAPPPPPRLQLIGIIHQAGELRAALYDADADRLLIVRSGQRIKDTILVGAISEQGVELVDGSIKHQMRLNREAGS